MEIVDGMEGNNNDKIGVISNFIPIETTDEVKKLSSSVLGSDEKYRSFICTLIKDSLKDFEGEFIDEIFLDNLISDFIDNKLVDINDYNSSEENYNSNLIKKRRFLNKVCISVLGNESKNRIFSLLDLKEEVQNKKSKNIEKKAFKISSIFSGNIVNLITILLKNFIDGEPNNHKELLRLSYELYNKNYLDFLISKDLLHHISFISFVAILHSYQDLYILTNTGELSSSETEDTIIKLNGVERNNYLKEINNLNNGTLYYIIGLILKKGMETFNNEVKYTLHDIESKILEYKYGIRVKNKLAIKILDSDINKNLSDLIEEKQIFVMQIFLENPLLFVGTIGFKNDELFNYLLSDLDLEKYEKIRIFLSNRNNKKLEKEILLDIFKNDNWAYGEKKEVNNSEKTSKKSTGTVIISATNHYSGIQSTNKESYIKRKVKVKTRGIPNKGMEVENNSQVNKILPKNNYDKYLLELLNSKDKEKIRDFKEKIEKFLVYICDNMHRSKTSSTQSRGADTSSGFLTRLIKRKYLYNIKGQLDNIFSNKGIISFDHFVADERSGRNCKLDFDFDIFVNKELSEKYLFDAIFGIERIISYMGEKKELEFKLVKEEFQDKITGGLNTYFRDIE